MRPLIEILEDERMLMLKIDSIYKYILRTDDADTLEILNAKRVNIERDLSNVRDELRNYISDLFT